MYLVRKINFGFNDILASAGEGGEEGFSEEEGQGNHHLEKLVLEIQRSLDFFESGIQSFSHQPPDRRSHGEKIILKSFRFFERNLSVKVRLLDANELFDGNSHLSSLLQARCLTAIGGAMRGIAGRQRDPADQSLPGLPERKKRSLPPLHHRGGSGDRASCPSSPFRDQQMAG